MWASPIDGGVAAGLLLVDLDEARDRGLDLGDQGRARTGGGERLLVAEVGEQALQALPLGGLDRAVASGS